MTHQPKTITDHNNFDTLIEDAIELQQRARQNHGMTLDITLCINIVLKDAHVNAMARVSEALEDVIDMAGAQ